MYSLPASPLILFSSLLLLIGFIFAFKLLSRRLASDVINDLSGEESEQKASDRREEQRGLNLAAQAAKELSFLRVLSADELSAINRQIHLKISAGLLAGIFLALIIPRSNYFLLPVFSLAGASLGFVIAQAALRRREEKFKNDIIFFLPVVMERIVMAVQAGLDIVPALKVIDEVEQSSRAKDQQKTAEEADAVSRLLRRIVKLCESGFSFQAAVNDVTSVVDSHALKHALIHLAVAQKEGGELIFPLRELSDATQLYFQESVEEDIARMPIKATLPLLITFAGLIVTFMTGPLIQIMNVSANPKFISEAPAGQQTDTQLRVK